MPLSYPSEWKFGEFTHEIPNDAHWKFLGLIDRMVEGEDDQQSIYEDFKTAFGNPNGSSSASWALLDMQSTIGSMTENAARYVAAFYAGCEAVKKRNIGIPSVAALNKILSEYEVPLVIKPPYLLLSEDADEVEEEEDGPVEFVRRGSKPSTVSSFVTTPASKKVFIVHGHDNQAKLEVSDLLKKLSLQPIILHEQPNKGRTIIEKFEINASDVAFAVVLLTPDDVGAAKKDQKSPGLKERARENVVFEMGFFFAKLGRERVCALVKGGTGQPSDVSGIVYQTMDAAGSWKTDLAKELKAAGMPVDLNDL